jgi:hypothetical protein
MPVRFTVATHNANQVQPWRGKPGTAEGLLDSTWGSKQESMTCGELLQSSLTSQIFSESHIHAKTNGFVETIIAAYNNHHHLILRSAIITVTLLRTID